MIVQSKAQHWNSLFGAISKITLLLYLLNKYVKEDETIIYVLFFLLETRFMFFRIAVEWDFVDTQLPLVKAQWFQ